MLPVFALFIACEYSCAACIVVRCDRVLALLSGILHSSVRFGQTAVLGSLPLQPLPSHLPLCCDWNALA